MTAPDGYQRPDWVVLGSPHQNGVMILASKDLTQAELEFERDDLMAWGRVEAVASHYRITLTVEMRTYVVVFADTYAEAWQRLFQQWQPEEPTAIEGRRAIEP